MSTAIALARLRASPAYELVPLERLTRAEHDVLEGVTLEDDLYGVFRPRSDAGRPYREAPADVALLFLSLGEAGALPSYVVRRLGEELDDCIAKLVLDGVLEVEHEGSFLSGADAVAALTVAQRDGTPGRIAELSAAALRYGQALAVPVEVLALRLYLYGRVPVTAHWTRRLGGKAHLDAFLGLPRAARGWIEAPMGAEEPWRVWQPGHRAPSGEGSARYKLYVSAALDAMPEVLPEVAEGLARVPGATGFKLARDVSGLCRPDKLVAHFGRHDDLLAAAEELRGRLAGCRPHGVPFTAEITTDGLLTWGLDPPPRNAARRATEPGSWRYWIVSRLAEYLAEARMRDARAPEPWRFALERLRLDGIDPTTWVPKRDLWDDKGVAAASA